MSAGKPRRVAIAKVYTDDQKVERWTEIDERIKAGVVVADDEKQFWSAFQRSSYFKIKQKYEADFEELLATRKA